jgi:hypothetical protein
MRFRHNRHQNIRVSHDGTVARRVNNSFFSRGLVFGTRPVKANERVTFKLMEVTDNLGAFVYVGFTSHNPDNLKGVTCQHLATNSGYWSWFFPKDLCTQNTLLFFLFERRGGGALRGGERGEGRVRRAGEAGGALVAALPASSATRARCGWWTRPEGRSCGPSPTGN